MTISVNNNGTWTGVQNVWVNDNGTWRNTTAVWVNDNGTWKAVRGTTIPTFSPTTANTFRSSAIDSDGNIMVWDNTNLYYSEDGGNTFSNSGVTFDVALPAQRFISALGVIPGSPKTWVFIVGFPGSYSGNTWSVYTSTDRRTFTKMTNVQSDAYFDNWGDFGGTQIPFNGTALQMCIRGNDSSKGYLLITPSALTAVAGVSGGNNGMYSSSFNGSLLISCGFNGAIQTASSTNTNITNRTSGATQILNTAASIGNVTICAGYINAVVANTNGAGDTWTAQTTGATGAPAWYTSTVDRTNNRIILYGESGWRAVCDVEETPSYPSNASLSTLPTPQSGSGWGPPVPAGSNFYVVGVNGTTLSLNTQAFSYGAGTQPRLLDYIAVGNSIVKNGAVLGTVVSIDKTNNTIVTSAALNVSVNDLVFIGQPGVWATVSGGTTNSAAYTTDNGASWSLVTLTASQRWLTPVWNGSVWMFGPSFNVTSNTANTYNGTTVSAVTLTASQIWNTPVWNGSVWMFGPSSTSTTANTYNGTTVSAVTLTASQGWRPPAWNGSYWMFGPSSFTTANTYNGTTVSVVNLTASQDWQPPVWNGSVWMFSPILLSPFTIVNTYDGTTVSEVTLTTSQVWRNPVWNGSVWMFGPDFTTSTANIFDGTTVSEFTLTATQGWRPPVWNGSYWMFGPSSTSIANTYNGTTVSAVTLTASQSWNTPVWNGSVWMFGPSTTSTTANTYNGTTVSAVTLTASQGWWTPVWNGSVWMFGPFSTSTANTYNGTTASAVTLTASQSWNTPVWNGSTFMFGTSTTNSTTFNTLKESKYTLTWSSSQVSGNNGIYTAVRNASTGVENVFGSSGANSRRLDL